MTPRHRGGLINHFTEHGFYFKYNFEPFSSVSDNFYDYFVILTEKEYAPFRLTGTLTPSLDYRTNVLNLHCGTGSRKHALYMCLLSSHTGRNSQSHYVVHFRLSLELI